MSFDQFAGQGDTAAWDPEVAAATKKAADKIFTAAAEAEVSGTSDRDEDEPHDEQAAVDDDQPGEVPDPDVTRHP